MIVSKAFGGVPIAMLVYQRVTSRTERKPDSSYQEAHLHVTKSSDHGDFGTGGMVSK